MELLTDALLDWISQYSGYDTHNIPPPTVVELSPHEITREAYTGVAHLMPDDGVDKRINALYDQENAIIYILDADVVQDAEYFEEPTDNPIFREILLHELVHHVQHTSGAAADWECLALGEKEAYRLGGLYLKQTGTTDPLHNRIFWGAIYSRC